MSIPVTHIGTLQPEKAAARSTVEMHINYYAERDEKNRTHGYDETWESLTLHCPNCGEKKVWHETSGGDCHVEELYLCTACNHGFYLPRGVSDQSDDQQSKQRLQALKDMPNGPANL